LEFVKNKPHDEKKLRNHDIFVIKSGHIASEVMHEISGGQGWRREC
jgi:hypothetical protein